MADPSSEEEDGDLDFDAIALKAVAAAGLQATSKSSSVAPKELGLDIDLDPDQLYFSRGEVSQATIKKRRWKPVQSYDTAAPPGVCRLRIEDFSTEAIAPEASSSSSREVRNAPVRPVDDTNLRKKEAKDMKDSRLAKWFGMKKQILTPEMEKELKAIKLRGNIDPKRFYKGNDSKELPKYFTMATDMGGGMRAAGERATREPKPGSGRTFLDQVLRDQKVQEWTRGRALEVAARGVASAQSGHGKRNSKGTKRGGAWKKKKRS